MNESEFNKLTDALLARIENAIDASGADIECSLNGPVLELEFDDGSQIIINRHAPNQEIWLAARAGGFHYGYEGGKWVSRRDGSELFAKLGELVRMAAGEEVTF